MQELIILFDWLQARGDMVLCMVHQLGFLFELLVTVDNRAVI